MIEDVKSVIASRLRAARERAGLSQGQVAKKLNKHRPTISEIEAGRRSVTAEEIGEFARLYGVETWWLTCVDPEDQLVAKNAKLQLAARDLSNMDREDLNNLISLLTAMKKDNDG